MGKNGTGWDFFEGFQSRIAMFGNNTPRGSAAQRVLVVNCTRHETNLEACTIFKSAARLFATGRGSKPALFETAWAPIGDLLGKLAEKPGENHQKRAEKWRQMALFRGSKAPFRHARSGRC